MSEILNELSSAMLVGPIWPATVLVGLLVLYTLLALIGLVDLDLDVPDVDVDVEIDLADGVDLDVLQGIGAASLRYVNLGRVPMIIWGGVFTVFFWSVSYTLWHHFDADRYSPTILASTLLSIRNVVLATMATKFVTAPLVKHFAPAVQYDSGRLIGATCEVSSLEVSAKHGQAKFRTDAAPLLLNVRSRQQNFVRGDEVRILDYDPRSRLYIVGPLDAAAPRSSNPFPPSDSTITENRAKIIDTRNTVDS